VDRNDIEVLLGQVALKDAKAFSALYDATCAKLFGICLRVLGNQAQAEDALQEIYAKIWAKADRYNVNGLSPMTWLITVARNHCIDLLRQRKQTDPIEDHATALRDPSPTVEATLIAKDQARDVAHCMDQLPEGRAEAVRGVYLLGKTYQDLADQQDVPLNTMRTWLRRALISLRECLSK
jgi:RNA polymerase sigma-70 factor (ECF subfamily)